MIGPAHPAMTGQMSVAPTQPPISPKEFRDWFRGLVAGMEKGGVPDAGRWAKVVEMVEMMSTGLGDRYGYTLEGYQAQAEAMRKAALLGPQTSAFQWPLTSGYTTAAAPAGQMQNSRAMRAAGDE